MKTKKIEVDNCLQDVINVALFIILAFALKICVKSIYDLVRKVDKNILLMFSIFAIYGIVQYFEVEILRKKN